MAVRPIGSLSREEKDLAGDEEWRNDKSRSEHNVDMNEADETGDDDGGMVAPDEVDGMVAVGGMDMIDGMVTVDVIFLLLHSLQLSCTFSGTMCSQIKLQVVQLCIVLI